MKLSAWRPAIILESALIMTITRQSVADIRQPTFNAPHSIGKKLRQHGNRNLGVIDHIMSATVK